ncbi:inactive phospholipase D5 isoform X4 [Mus musculus]|uniref:inactive phospholipase D5 isoform X4 n=1 Tax=Mus musculus TaxID=10090 RepID=UPI0011AE9355|nr:inactive phospholipase D5 isoform X4 [Mus musculus]
MRMDSQRRIAKINVGKRIALVENIPEGLNYSEDAPFHLPLFQGWMNLLNMAKKSVDIVSSHWDLNHTHPAACQGQRLFEKLLQLTSQNIEVKLVSDVTADSKMKELGVIFYNCSCLVLDLQRIFALYSSLKFKSRVPQTWSKRLYGVYDNEKKLQLQLNETKSQAFVSNSPKLFCPKNRSFDIDAIYSVIDDAKQYVYIAVTDYLPISSTSSKRTYWPDLDGKIREALVLRSVKVRLLISFWKETDPLTFNFISSLKAICTEIANCSLKVKFFDLERENACATKEQKNQTFPKLNRNKYMVTDGAAYIGNFDWVGNDFTQNAGTGLVINQADVRDNRSIIKQLKDVFERDWYSPYAKSIQPTKQPNCSSLSKLKSPSKQPAMANATGREPLSV